MYQNPTKFDNDITCVEFDRDRGVSGNDYLTYVEWTDEDGIDRHGCARDNDIPDHIRLQIALQIAGDLIQPIQK